MNEGREDFDRYCEWVHSFDVKTWQVMVDRRAANGAPVQEPLTPLHADRRQAEAAFAAIRQDEPGAYIMEGTYFFHPEKAEDMKSREDLIASMVREPA